MVRERDQKRWVIANEQCQRFAHLSTPDLKSAWLTIQREKAERAQLAKEAGHPVGSFRTIVDLMAEEYERRIAARRMRRAQ